MVELMVELIELVEMMVRYTEGDGVFISQQHQPWRISDMNSSSNFNIKGLYCAAPNAAHSPFQHDNP